MDDEATAVAVRAEAAVVELAANYRGARVHYSADLKQRHRNEPVRGRSGHAVCSGAAGRPFWVDDQRARDWDAMKRGRKPKVIAEMPLCRTCERVALRDGLEVSRG